MKNVLWTGGWDSTFRVLDLTILKKQEVQPFYIIDHDRLSKKVELKTMNKIKQKLEEMFPDSKGLIKETVFIQKDKIPENKNITDKFNRLIKESFMGTQYDWLARYSEANNIQNLELNIHKDDHAEVFVRKYVDEISKDNDLYYTLKSNAIGTDYDLFKYYNFPLLDYTKTEMGEIAKANGFSDLMELTWFCFKPTLRGTPCGSCNPCKYTRDEGLGRRVPSKFMTKYNVVENKIYYKIKRSLGVL